MRAAPERTALTKHTRNQPGVMNSAAVMGVTLRPRSAPAQSLLERDAEPADAIALRRDDHPSGDITRLRQIQRLISDLGVNLAGVEVIIRMNRRLQEAEVELQRLREELEYCRANHRR